MGREVSSRESVVGEPSTPPTDPSAEQRWALGMMLSKLRLRQYLLWSPPNVYPIEPP